MTEVMFEMVAMILEHIDVFIFHFPARPTDLNDFGNIGGGKGVIGGPRIMEQHRPCRFVGDGQFTPVHQESSSARAERDLVCPTMRADFGIAVIPVPYRLRGYATDFVQ